MPHLIKLMAQKGAIKGAMKGMQAGMEDARGIGKGGHGGKDSGKDMAVCALHGKSRNRTHLMDSGQGDGRFICMPGRECRGSGPGSADTARGDQGMCSLHMKPRGLQ